MRERRFLSFFSAAVAAFAISSLSHFKKKDISLQCYIFFVVNDDDWHKREKYEM
jgi:hypothetical protein